MCTAHSCKRNLPDHLHNGICDFVLFFSGKSQTNLKDTLSQNLWESSTQAFYFVGHTLRQLYNFFQKGKKTSFLVNRANPCDVLHRFICPLLCGAVRSQRCVSHYATLPQPHSTPRHGSGTHTTSRRRPTKEKETNGTEKRVVDTRPGRRENPKAVHVTGYPSDMKSREISDLFSEKVSAVDRVGMAVAHPFVQNVVELQAFPCVCLFSCQIQLTPTHTANRHEGEVLICHLQG